MGLTPVDALVVIVSPHLDQPEHLEERVSWVFAEDVDAMLTTLGVVWSDVADNQGERFV